MRWNVTIEYLGTKRRGYFASSAKLHFLAKQKSRIGHTISHLHKVFDRQVSDRIGIDFSRLFEFAKTRFQSGPWRSNNSNKASAIFKPTIDSLPKERNNRVRGIAQQQGLCRLRATGEHLMVTIAPVGLRKKVVSQIRHEARRIRETATEKNRLRSRESSIAAKLSGPSNGRKRMQANVPSILGSAISM